MRMVFMAYISGSMEAVDFYFKAFNAKSNGCCPAEITQSKFKMTHSGNKKHRKC